MHRKRQFLAHSYQALDKHPNLKRFAEEEDSRGGLSSHEKMRQAGLISRGLANFTQNRYSNIVPYDHSLAPCALGYVNASLVNFPQVSYVVAAGPMSPEYYGNETRDRFWSCAMDCTNTVRVMVCLCKFEPGYSGCSNYVENGAFYGDYLVNVLEQDDEEECFTKRIISVQHMDDTEATIVTHFQFHDWDNYSVASCNLQLARFVRKVDECWRDFGQARGRIMVNCSGGVGRSGTFVAIHQTWLQYLQYEEDSSLDKLVFQQVVHLRQSRHPWMVEGESQYKLISQVVNLLIGE